MDIYYIFWIFKSVINIKKKYDIYHKGEYKCPNKITIIYIMKLLVICIILFMLYLCLNHFYQPNKTMEGLEVCNKTQDDLTFKNTASIEQQQSELKDLEEEINRHLKTLQTKVTGFQRSISKNNKNIALNAKNLKSSMNDIKNAAQAQQAQLDKAAGGL